MIGWVLTGWHGSKATEGHLKLSNNLWHILTRQRNSSETSLIGSFFKCTYFILLYILSSIIMGYSIMWTFGCANSTSRAEWYLINQNVFIWDDTYYFNMLSLGVIRSHLYPKMTLMFAVHLEPLVLVNCVCYFKQHKIYNNIEYIPLKRKKWTQLKLWLLETENLTFNYDIMMGYCHFNSKIYELYLHHKDRLFYMDWNKWTRKGAFTEEKVRDCCRLTSWWVWFCIDGFCCSLVLYAFQAVNVV